MVSCLECLGYYIKRVVTYYTDKKNYAKKGTVTYNQEIVEQFSHFYRQGSFRELMSPVQD